MPGSAQRRRLPWRGALMVVLALTLACTAWLAVRAVLVAGHLQQARSELSALSDLSLDLDATAEAQAGVERAQEQTAAARAGSSDPVWRLAEHVPVVGDDLRAVRVVAGASDVLTADVAAPLLDTAAAVDVGSLRREDGSVDLAPLRTVQPALDDAATAAAAAQADLAGVETRGLVGPVAEAVAELDEQASRLAAVSGELARAARVLPPLLGADGPRRYLLAFQNPAEARATGGIVGTYGILDVSDGRFSLAGTGTNNELDTLPEPPADLGEDYRALYGRLPAHIDNVNMSPHFPYAAQQLLGHYAVSGGEQLDGVFALDPEALGMLLEATGPLVLTGGEEVDHEQVADLTMRLAYERYPDRQQRTDFLLDVVQRTFDAITAPATPTDELAKALVTAGQERRLMVYSTNETEERDLEQMVVGGALPVADGGTRAVVVNNAGANKLDYYLDVAVRYEVGCATQGRTASRLRVVLTNTAPTSGLPAYVDSHRIPELAATPSTHRVIVSAFLPAPTGVDGLEVDGRTEGFVTGRERGYDVFSVTVDVPAGQDVELVWALDEPLVGDHVRLLGQPMVRPVTQSVEQTCVSG